MERCAKTDNMKPRLIVKQTQPPLFSPFAALSTVPTVIIVIRALARDWTGFGEGQGELKGGRSRIEMEVQYA